jgi:predicted SnoaL-like aldol condensation-catalyzing enzyme
MPVVASEAWRSRGHRSFANLGSPRRFAPREDDPVKGRGALELDNSQKRRKEDCDRHCKLRLDRIDRLQDAARGVSKENEMTQAIEEKNKALVLEAFETLFNKRDYAAAERFWSPAYIQHSAHIPPGREGLFALVKGVPENFRYENGLTVADGDYVFLHGRFSNIGLPANWIVVDIVRLENGQLPEHWDVIQDEATKESSVSGLPMFGDRFPT